MEGLEAYTGEQINSRFYREPSRHKDKNVPIVGLGYSAVDLAVELSMNDCQVNLSARRGHWIASRWLMGRPLDHRCTRFSHKLPLALLQSLVTVAFRLSAAPPLGAIMPISEMQCRFLVGTLTGKLPPLPLVDKMEAEIKKLQSQITKRYGKAPRHTIQVDYAPYCVLAGQVHRLLPRFWLARRQVRPLQRSLPLARDHLGSPPCPVQYHLVGPGLWAGARESVWAYAKKGPVPPG
ncbi:hypothetical protein DFQ27_004196 [Actinomortierella ambigua]|uniref:Flavin-containing monooxygenase n=1 Tax=Actinomortierella ambigua TaxID=1343610 RepID=A0A9P6Q5Y4_9FUNG|nr:hypothetical protein DFQ27_004196 [Actinomortierella ambigua]